MNSTHIFSIHRVGALIKRDLMENKKSYLKTYTGILLAFVLALFIKMTNANVLVYSQSPDVAGSLFAASMASTFLVIYIWASYAFASFMMLHMQTKEQRINFLMVPATQVEKYLSRLLLMVVAPLVGMIAMVLLTDIFHMFLSLFIGTPGVTDHWVFPSFLHRFSLFMSAPQGISSILAGIFSYVMFFWGQSLFVLGGCFWTKSAFLKTLATMFLALIVMIIVISSSAIHHMDFLYNMDDIITDWLHAHKWFSMDLALSLVAILFFWFTVLNYWLGYRLFSRTQIIRPKFLGR
jgi:hypothetical protein